MAAEIKSGASADLATVDPTSKAIRVSLRKTNGDLLIPEYDGNYCLPIEIVPSTLTDGTVYWAFRNTGAKRVFIHKMRIKVGFAGTPGASGSRFQLRRFSAATPTGGTALDVIKFDNTQPASSVGDARFAPAGLTVAGVSFESRFEMFGVTSDNNNDAAAVIDFGEHPFVVAPNEGISISAYGAVIAGSWIIGAMSWDERT